MQECGVTAATKIVAMEGVDQEQELYVGRGRTKDHTHEVDLSKVHK